MRLLDRRATDMLDHVTGERCVTLPRVFTEVESESRSHMRVMKPSRYSLVSLVYLCFDIPVRDERRI